LQKFLIFLLLLFNISILSQQTAEIRFRVISKNLPNSTNIFISGNDEKLGSWNSGLIPLEQTSDSTWERLFKFKVGSVLEFKFTKGSWKTEALDEYGNIPQNHALDVENDTTLSFFISEWNNGQTETDFSGQITGKVNYLKKVEFEGLEPRDVIVWMPPGYEENNEKHYPVLYMHDGQNLFDPETAFMEIDWQMDEAADSLISNKIIEPLLIVGVYNTQNRSDEYSPSFTGELYMKFIVDKLKPMIDSIYRTKRGRNFTAVGGSSMGGLISFMLAWNYPNIFSKAACFSPAFMYHNFDYTTVVKNPTQNKNSIKFYIDNGGVGLEKTLRPGIELMVSELKNKGYKLNEDLFVVIDSSAQHNEEAWAKRVPNMLKLFFGIKNK